MSVYLHVQMKIFIYASSRKKATKKRAPFSQTKNHRPSRGLFEGQFKATK